MKKLFQTLLVFVFALILVGCNVSNQNPTCEHDYIDGVCSKCKDIQEENEILYNQTGFDGKGMEVVIYCNVEENDPFHESYIKNDKTLKQERINEIQKFEKTHFDIYFDFVIQHSGTGGNILVGVELDQREWEKSLAGEVFVGDAFARTKFEACICICICVCVRGGEETGKESDKMVYLRELLHREGFLSGF